MQKGRTRGLSSHGHTIVSLTLPFDPGWAFVTLAQKNS